MFFDLYDSGYTILLPITKYIQTRLSTGFITGAACPYLRTYPSHPPHLFLKCHVVWGPSTSLTCARRDLQNVTENVVDADKGLSNYTSLGRRLSIGLNCLTVCMNIRLLSGCSSVWMFQSTVFCETAQKRFLFFFAVACILMMISIFTYSVALSSRLRRASWNDDKSGSNSQARPFMASFSRFILHSFIHSQHHPSLLSHPLSH